MAITLNSKQVVSSEELLMSQGLRQEALTRFACGERDICQGGVFSDAEANGSGDEEKMVGYCFKSFFRMIKKLIGGARQWR